MQSLIVIVTLRANSFLPRQICHQSRPYVYVDAMTLKWAYRPSASIVRRLGFSTCPIIT